MLTRLALLVSASFMLASCGTHGDVPVTYGQDGVARPVAYGAPQGTSVALRPGPATTAPTPVSQPAPQRLQPVSAVYLSEESAPAAKKANGPGSVRVRAGDTVYAIGRRYDVAPQAIIAENRLSPPYHLTVGQTLRLPETTLASAKNDKKAATQKVVARDTLYRVQEGDTLYSISRRSGVPVKSIAQANSILPPYAINKGQQLLLPQAPVDSALYAANSKSSGPAQASGPAASLTEPKSVTEIAKNVSYKTTEPSGNFFEWPVKGNIVGSFGTVELGRRNDGVNIAAPTGSPVRAAADGEVVYRGSELEGFGNLLLVKHTDGYVTAYAHNDSMLVKKGDRVHQGQVIAKVGQTGSVTTPQLHFEIRQNLKTIDPVALLGPN